MFICLVLGLVVGQSSGFLPSEAPSARGIFLETPKGKRTPMSALEARLHLELAYSATFGIQPSDQTLSRMVAQWALETARGAQMWSYNFGGLKAGKGGVSLQTRESYGTSERQVTEPFRTYRSAAEGARDYVKTLFATFPKSFSSLHHGTAQEFVEALANENYFTGDRKRYHRAITLLSEEFSRE
jgi:flagellum-specific peptidoglycan hydrolase FlgJ